MDPADIEAVRRFVKDNPGNPHAAEAQKTIDNYDAEQRRAALERARLEQAAQERIKQDLASRPQNSQQRSRADDLSKQQVLNTLKQLDSALQRKRPRDVKAIWPGATRLFLDSLGNSHVKMSLALRTGDVRFSEGTDRAVAECDLVTVIDTTSRNQKMMLVLRNARGAWTVETAKID